MTTELKAALRSFARSPGVSALALATMTLGIGATTAIFSVVNTVLLQPLPYSQPEQLARVCSEFPNYPNGGLRRFAVSTPEYLYFRRELKSLQSVEAWSAYAVNITTASEPVRVTAASVSGGLFATLGVAPASGRVIGPTDDQPGAAPVAVVSHGLSESHLGGDGSTLGRDIEINGQKHTVIGVMPKDFAFPLGGTDAPKVWTALRTDPGTTEFSGHNLHTLGRLKTGVLLTQAQAELDVLVKNAVATSPGHHFDSKDHTLAIYGLQDDIVHAVRPALRVLFAAVVFLLLIACVNVANLFLARAEARQREIAVRTALGAGPGRLARQFVMEGLLISLLGSMLGLALAFGALAAMSSTTGIGIPRVTEIGVDLRVVIFTITVGALSGLVFSLAPLFHALRGNLYGAIKSASYSPAANRFRQALVISQIALALVLLTGTGLMLKAFLKTREVDPGFNPRGVLTAFTQLPNSTYRGDARQQFWTRLEERLAELPEVQRASISATLPPVFDNGVGFGVVIDGYTPAAGGTVPSMPTPDGLMPLVDRIQIVTAGYLDTFGIRLVAGRFFDPRDGPQAPRTAVVNKAFAEAVWGSERTLGRRIRPGGSSEWHTIVGIVADVKNNGVERPTGTEIYLSYSQASPGQLSSVYLAVRSGAAPSTLVGTVRRTLQAIDPTLPVTKVRTMEEVVAQTQSRPRFYTLLLVLFSTVAMTLAAGGIYGVVAYSVVQKTREFGVRLALGAEPRAVVGQVMRQGFVLVACGIAIGTAGAAAATRGLSSMLFGVTPGDPLTFSLAALVLAIVAAIACFIPARRATKVDPLIVLRES